MESLCMKAALMFGLVLCLPAASAQAATTFTGDKIQGVSVITQLDVDNLEPGKTQRFMFQGVEMGTGQYWYVPVMVAKGAKAGKRVLLVSGVHGDELNPIGAVHKVFADVVDRAVLPTSARLCYGSCNCSAQSSRLLRQSPCTPHVTGEGNPGQCAMRR